MIKLSQSIEAWGTPTFEQVLKTEIECLNPDALPLQKGLTYSSYISAEPFSPVILKTTVVDDFLHVKTTIFYTGIMAGCSCADDPTPQDLQNESCDILFRINRCSGETQVELI